MKYVADQQQTFRNQPLRTLSVAMLTCVAIMASSGCAQLKEELDKIELPFQKDGKTSAASTKASRPAQRPTRASRWIRTGSDQNRLFRKKTVTGEDLLKELIALKAAVVSGNLTGGLSGLMGSTNASSAEQRSMMAWFREAWAGVFSSGNGAVAVKSAEDFFNRVLGRRELLAEQTLDLPDPAQLNRLERQQVLILASMVMGFKVSNVIMSDAADDLKQVEQMYQNLLKRRTDAAKLLLDVLVVRAQADKARQEEIARDLRSTLSPDDVALLEGLAESQDLEAFARDLGAQNLALNYMRKKDPAQYREYRVEADRFVSEYASLLRAVAGAGAFAAFGRGFYSKAQQMIEQSGLLGVLKIPFGREIIQESAQLSSTAKSLTSSSITDIFFKGGGFNLYKDNLQIGSRVTVRDVAEQFEAVDGGRLLKERLIAGKSRGFLNRVYACEPQVVGDYLDRAVPREARLAFATSYFGLKDIASDFTFRNAFDGAIKSRNRKNMVRDLLRRDSPKASGPITRSIIGVHEAARENLSKMERREFMRLIFANARDNPTQASVSVGPYKVSIVPSRDSVYVYEKYIQSCMKSFVK